VISVDIGPMFMQNNSIDIRLHHPHATVVINRPDRHNALSLAMIEKLREAWFDLQQEKRVRGVILTGAGESFCSGRDLLEMAESGEDEARQMEDQQQWGEEANLVCDLLSDMLTFPKPIIASVNGPVHGLGVALVMASDLVIAASTATLSLPEPRRGLVAGVTAPLLSYRVGAGHAARLLLTSQPFDAEEMLRIGLYHEVVHADKVWARGAELAHQCAEGAPQAISLTKRLLLETVGEKLLTDLSNGALLGASARTTHAAREGLQSFVEHRDPEWD
jgi:methylglutaconyl-CoA hydratase